LDGKGGHPCAADPMTLEAGRFRQALENSWERLRAGKIGARFNCCAKCRQGRQGPARQARGANIATIAGLTYGKRGRTRSGLQLADLARTKPSRQYLLKATRVYPLAKRTIANSLPPTPSAGAASHVTVLFFRRALLRGVRRPSNDRSRSIRAFHHPDPYLAISAAGEVDAVASALRRRLPCRGQTEHRSSVRS